MAQVTLSRPDIETTPPGMLITFPAPQAGHRGKPGLGGAAIGEEEAGAATGAVALAVFGAAVTGAKVVLTVAVLLAVIGDVVGIVKFVLTPVGAGVTGATVVLPVAVVTTVVGTGETRVALDALGTAVTGAAVALMAEREAVGGAVTFVLAVEGDGAVAFAFVVGIGVGTLAFAVVGAAVTGAVVGAAVTGAAVVLTAEGKGVAVSVVFAVDGDGVVAFAERVEVVVGVGLVTVAFAVVGAAVTGAAVVLTAKGVGVTVTVAFAEEGDGVVAFAVGVEFVVGNKVGTETFAVVGEVVTGAAEELTVVVAAVPVMFAVVGVGVTTVTAIAGAPVGVPTGPFGPSAAEVKKNRE